MLATPEPSPRSHAEHSASLTGSLRARSAIRATGEPIELNRDSNWWNPGDAAEQPPVPGSSPERPQGIAESTFNPRGTPFSQAPSPSLARELSAAAPSPPPSRGGLPPAAAGAPASRTGTHVQFAKSPDSIPGEVPTTPIAPRTNFSDTVAFARSFGPGAGAAAMAATATAPFGGLPGSYHHAGTAPSSPERPRRLLTTALTKRFQSTTVTHHLVPLELKEQVEELPMELTLQHSNRIEKVSAADLIPLAQGEKPYYYGSRPTSATIKRLRGLSEHRKGAFYVPSDITDAAASGSREVISGTLGWNPRDRPILVQLLVLFPSLMRPPRWLRKDFTEVKMAGVEVDWDLSSGTRFFLFMTRQLDRAEGQTLSVWASKRKYGGGETFTLYGAEGTAQLTDRSYVLMLRFLERRDGPGPRAAVLSSRDGPLLTRLSGNGAAPMARALTTGLSVGLGGSGGGAEAAGGSEVLAGAPSFPRTPGTGTGTFGHKGLTRLEALQWQQHLLLRAQSSNISAQLAIPEGAILTWDSVLDHLIRSHDAPALRELIDSHLTDSLLKSQALVDRVEKVAITANDAPLMLVLYEHTPVEMDLHTLAFLLHAWATQPLSARAAAAAARSASRSAASAVSAAPFLAGTGLEEEVVMMEDQMLLEGVDPVEAGLAARIEEFLVKYVIQRRNPLSATAAILRAIEDEMDQHEDNRRTMRLAYSRFHSLHLALLRRCNRYAELRHISLIERILQPAELPNTVNEVSPLQVAFDSQDLKFMTESLVELFTKVQWVGRELLALTAHEEARGTGATNPLLAYSVLRSLGFAGKGTMDPLVIAGSRLWHLYTFTSTAFFNSPRGRWCMHVLFELGFLALYQWQVMWPKARHLEVVHLVFLACIAGNLLDILLFVHYRHGSLARIRRYLVDPWNALSLLVNSALAVLTCLKLAQDFHAPGLPAYQTADAIHMSMATLAVFVWVRALGMAVPVYPSLGPLLNTVARMMEEVIAFLFPLVVVMTGFATMMAAVYTDFPATGYNGFLNSMLQLFSAMLGNFSLDSFNGLGEVLDVYGNVVLVVFLVISAILLMNLLIAIVTNRYRPQEVEAETQFKKAQIVTFYNTQVTRNLVCSPFCLVQVAVQTLGVLPSGRRNKLSGSAAQLAALGLLPLDGVVLPDDGSDRPTGLGEVPHLVFLLTLYPLLAAVTWAIFLLYTPFGVWQFASKQYTHLGKWVRKRGQRREQARRAAQQQQGKKGQQKQAASRWQRAAQRQQQQQEQQQQQPQREQQREQQRKEAPAADGSPLLDSSADGLSTPREGSTSTLATATGTGTGSPDTANGPVLDTISSSPAAAAAAAAADGDTDAAASPAAASASAGVSRSSSKTLGGQSADAVKQYQRLKKALQAEAKQSNMGWGASLAFVAGTTLLAAVGLLVYLVVMLLVVLVGWSSVYLWVAKVLFSLYNIFVRPIVDAVRARRRQHQPRAALSVKSLGGAAGAASPPRPSAGGAQRNSHIALDVASSAAATAAAGGAVPGDHGCGADAAAACGSQGAVSRSGGRFAALFSRREHGGGGVTAGSQSTAAAAAQLSGEAAAAAAAAAEREARLQQQRKARMHWQHAIQRVIALKNERYLSRRDVVKAVAASKFRPHMEAWNLKVDPRASSQDIMEEQMQDLEDDEDPWDDDMVTGDGDDDTIETSILQKTEQLHNMLKRGIDDQTAAMRALYDRLATLTEEVARLTAAQAAQAQTLVPPAALHRSGGGAGGGSSGGGAGSGPYGPSPLSGTSIRKQALGSTYGTSDPGFRSMAAAAASAGYGADGGAVRTPASPERERVGRSPLALGVQFSGLESSGAREDSEERLGLAGSLPADAEGPLLAPAAAASRVRWSPPLGGPEPPPLPPPTGSPAALPPSPSGDTAAEPPPPPQAAAAAGAGTPLRPPPGRAPTAYPAIAARASASTLPSSSSSSSPAPQSGPPVRRSASVDNSSGGARKSTEQAPAAAVGAAGGEAPVSAAVVAAAAAAEGDTDRIARGSLAHPTLEPIRTGGGGAGPGGKPPVPHTGGHGTQQQQQQQQHAKVAPAVGKSSSPAKSSPKPPAAATAAAAAAAAPTSRANGGTASA